MMGSVGKGLIGLESEVRCHLRGRITKPIHEEGVAEERCAIEEMMASQRRWGEEGI